MSTQFEYKGRKVEMFDVSREDKLPGTLVCGWVDWQMVGFFATEKQCALHAKQLIDAEEAAQ